MSEDGHPPRPRFTASDVGGTSAARIRNKKTPKKHSPISRTVGSDQLVDEMIFKFSHTVRMDWMLPGLAPTGRPVEVPLVAIIRFRGDKVVHEHIYWDQACVLVQLGLLETGSLPVAGVESARKAMDQSLPSNALIERAEQPQ